MLKEIKDVSQAEGEPRRRWFSSLEMDLITWHTAYDIIGFQLCYDKGADEHALTWMKDYGFTHRRIADGEGRGMQHKMTPILIPDGVLDVARIIREFEMQSDEIDFEVRGFVVRALKQMGSDSNL